MLFGRQQGEGFRLIVFAEEGHENARISARLVSRCCEHLDQIRRLI